MRSFSIGAGHQDRSFGGFETCNEALRRICGAYQVVTERWWEFRGSIQTHRAGTLEFADVAFSDGRVVRDRGDRHYRGDHFFLILQASGAARMRQRGSEASLGPGDCALIDSRFPSVFEIGPDFRQYSFHLPPQCVTERLGAALPLARTIRAEQGAGALLSQLLSAAVRNASTLGGVELTEMTIDLLAASLSIGSGRKIPRQPERRAVSLREMTQFIDMHVHSPHLSPTAVAAHFNTSVRRLYRLVSAAGWTPASLIWSRRLERARELLAQHTCQAPIIEIALTCGFKDGAHFSRAYRKAFGHPPKVARSLAAGIASRERLVPGAGSEAARFGAEIQPVAVEETGQDGSDTADSAWRTRSTEAGSKSGARRTSEVQMSA